MTGELGQITDSELWHFYKNTCHTRQVSFTEFKANYMTDTEKLKHCAGCRNNFYNGNNPMGVQRCWSLGTAKLILRKEIDINQRPPWTQKAQRFLSCYHRSGSVFVGPDQTC